MRNSTEVDTPFGRGDTRELDGLRVAHEPSGRITVRGTDRWGRAIEVTYETEEYFRNAVPTLSLSVTDGQAAKLRTLAEHVVRAAPSTPSAPTAPPSGRSGSGEAAGPSGSGPAEAPSPR